MDVQATANECGRSAMRRAGDETPGFFAGCVIFLLTVGVRVGIKVSTEGDRQMTIVSRTYNKYGDKDYLTRMEGNCPVWSSKKVAIELSEQDAKKIVELISTYRDWMCPNGIQGVAVE